MSAMQVEAATILQVSWVQLTYCMYLFYYCKLTVLILLSTHRGSFAAPFVVLDKKNQ